MKNAIEKIEGLTFGVEIEYTGLARDNIALAIAKELNAECRYEGRH